MLTRVYDPAPTVQGAAAALSEAPLTIQGVAENDVVGETPEDAHAEVLRLQEEYGRPTQEGGWTEEQHAQWNAQWRHWRNLVMAKHGYDVA